MGTYQDDRQWSDQWLDQIRSITGSLLVGGASFERDTREATDLIVDLVRNGRRGKRQISAIAARVRRPGMFWRLSRPSEIAYGLQFTIRAHRENGVETELSKLKKGFGDWYFYGHIEQKIVRHWMVLDLDVFRVHVDDPAIFTEPKDNGDGTLFISYGVQSFPSQIFVAKSETVATALDKGVEAVSPLPEPEIDAAPAREPPSLMSLVKRYGGYNKITPTAWAAYDEEMKIYKADVAAGRLRQEKDAAA